MKVMITGAGGFIGGFLAKHCVEVGACVLGLGDSEPGEIWPNAAFEVCDVRDASRLADLISKYQPERVFHLAAQSFPTVSLVRPRETIDINVGGTINLFEGLRTTGVMALVVVACSSAEYGLVDSRDLPVREDHLLAPMHPYGVSKVAQDLLTAQYFVNYGIPSVRIRIFNTTGPSKVGDVCSDLTRRVAEIELRLRPPCLTVGNLASRRAIVDVRDLVRGLWVSAEHCELGGVYNVGGNEIYSVHDVIEIIRTQVNCAFSVEQDAGLLRHSDEPVIAGDITKFRICSGWTAEIGLATTLRDMLGWWRKRLASGEAFARGGADGQPEMKERIES